MTTFTRITGGWKNVPKNLKTKTQLKEMGLKPSSDPVAEVYSGKAWRKLYDEKDTVKRKAVTTKQLAALEKARVAKDKALTCDRCGDLKSRKSKMNYTDDGQYCDWCYGRKKLEDYLLEEKEKAIEKLKKWFECNKILIIDVETTGLSTSDQIVEIAVMNKSSDTLFHSLVKPTCKLNEGAIYAHGITEEMLKDAPTALEISKQLSNLFKDKTLILFNEKFFFPMIRNTFENTNLNVSDLELECLQITYLNYIQEDIYDDSYITLEQILNRSIERRALSGCEDILEILNNIWENIGLE